MSNGNVMSKFVNTFRYNIPFKWRLINSIFGIVILFLSFTYLILNEEAWAFMCSIYDLLDLLVILYLFQYSNICEFYNTKNKLPLITSSHIFPVFRFDDESMHIINANSIPLYIFFNIGIVFLWGMFVAVFIVKFYPIGILAMILSFFVATVYSAQVLYKSRWVKDSSKLNKLSLKDIYTCLKQSMFSSIVGVNPLRNEDESNIESSIRIMIQMSLRNENLEAWWAIRQSQCYELGDCFCFEEKKVDLNATDDEELKTVAMKIQRFNPNIEEEKTEYFTQLCNLEAIDSTIQDRTFLKAKRFASFITQLKLSIKIKRPYINEQFYIKIARGPYVALSIPPSGLSFIPQNVKYEAGTYIELNLIGASMFMSWEWVRVKEICPKTASIHVFSDICIGNLKQGELGDYWVLAAITMLAMHAPQRLTSLFPNGETTAHSTTGKYALKLYVDGESKNIVMDDYFPCFKDVTEEYNPIGVQFQYDRASNQKFVWPMLLEKALAVEYDSYENLNYAKIDDAINLLTGEPTFRFNLLKEDIKIKIANGSLWKTMIEYGERAFIMGANSLPKEMMPENNMGIVPSYTYTIMDILECDSHKLIEAENILDETFWNGKWSPSSYTWTRRLQEIIRQHKAQKGKQITKRNSLIEISEQNKKSFYICFKDFLKYFEVIFFTISFDESWDKQVIKDSWTIGRAGGSIINIETVRCNPQYLITFKKNTKIFCLLHQIATYSNLDLPTIGFEIYKYKGKLIGDPEDLQTELVGSGMYAQERNITMSKMIEKGNYILLATTYFPDIWIDFTFTIWTKKIPNCESILSYVKLN